MSGRPGSTTSNSDRVARWANDTHRSWAGRSVKGAPFMRRFGFEALCGGAVVLAALLVAGPSRADPTPTPEPKSISEMEKKVVLFDRVRADFRFALVVPRDWNAGMPKVGMVPFSKDPVVELFGVVRSPDERVSGEVRCLVRQSGNDPRGVFIDLAQRRHGMELREARLVAGTAEQGEYLFSYVATDGRNGVEHLWIGRALAISLFYVSPGDLPEADRGKIYDSLRDSDVRFD